MIAAPRVAECTSIDRVQELCRQRALHLQKFGQGWRIHGKSVDILFSALDQVVPTDLKPATQRHMRKRSPFPYAGTVVA
jgi:hypothetical protein